MSSNVEEFMRRMREETERIMASRAQSNQGGTPSGMSSGTPSGMPSGASSEASTGEMPVSEPIPVSEPMPAQEPIPTGDTSNTEPVPTPEPTPMPSQEPNEPISMSDVEANSEQGDLEKDLAKQVMAYYDAEDLPLPNGDVDIEPPPMPETAPEPSPSSEPSPSEEPSEEPEPAVNTEVESDGDDFFSTDSGNSTQSNQGGTTSSESEPMPVPMPSAEPMSSSKPMDAQYRQAPEADAYDRDVNKLYTKIAEYVAKAFKKDVSRMAYNDKGVEKQKKKAYADKHTDYQSNFVFAKDTTMVNGQPYQYRPVIDESIKFMEFGLTATSTIGGQAQNLENFRKTLTDKILEYYGGVKAIKEIVIAGEMLIINGMMYTPVINKRELENLPLDSKDYLMNGMTAPFFNWYCLSKMRNLMSLSFDDISYVYNVLAPDIGKDRNWNILSIFKFKGLSSLRHLDVAGDVVEYPLDESDESAMTDVKDIQNNIKDGSRWDRLYEGYTTHFTDHLKEVRVDGWKHCGDYFFHKGNKNMFSWLVGSAVFATFMTAWTVGEVGAKLGGAGAHGLGVIAKENHWGTKIKNSANGVGNAFKDGFNSAKKKINNNSEAKD